MPAALPIAARGRACPKGPEYGLGTGSCADASAPRAIAAPERRRRKGGGDVRGPQGDDVAQAGRDHEAQEQGAARAARDDPDRGVRGVHGRARLPGRAAHEGEPRGEGQHHENPVRGLHGERLRGRRGRRAPWGRGRKDELQREDEEAVGEDRRRPEGVIRGHAAGHRRRPHLRDEELRLPDRARGGTSPSSPSTPASRRAERPR